MGFARLTSSGRRTVVTCLLAGLALAGCSQDAGDAGAPTTAVTGQTGVPQDPATGMGQPELPDGALGEQARWVLDQLAPDATGPTAEEAEQRFSADFLKAVPADEIERVFAQLRPERPLTLFEVTERPSSTGGTGGTDGLRSAALRLSGTTPLVVTLSVDAEGKIAGLLLQPDTSAEVDPLSSWADLDSRLADLEGSAQIHVADVREGRCTLMHETPGAGPAPAGSVFKLIVLSAVVDAVAEGDLAWTDELTITPELKSLPTGELQDRADGSTVTVQAAAELMIGISDNTATDLLMDAVGAERLQTAVDGVSTEPDRLTPLLTTRQFFLLGWGAPEVRRQWADADPEKRANLLAQLPAGLSGLNPAAVTDPAWTDGVGWFLSGAEICAAHAELQAQAATPAGEPVRDILSANPGLIPPAGTSYQAFKGGSAPGVLALSFYQKAVGGEAGRDREGAGRVLVVQVRDEGTIDDKPLIDLTQAGLALLVQR